MSKQDTIHIQTATIGEIVARNYHAAGVFRQFGLDFCCGGGITVQEACERKNLDPSVVLTGLREISVGLSAGQENYQSWEPGYLIDHIISTHHRFVRQKRGEISAYAAKVARVHATNHPENVEISKKFKALSKELIKHLEAEEEVVFPLIRDIYEKRVAGAAVTDEQVSDLRKELDLMVGDHEAAGAVLAELRKLSHNYTPPADACATYRILYQNLEGFEEDLQKHVHLENNILFKKAEKLV